MSTTILSTPSPDGLAEVVAALRDWQDDAAPVQLHPGDVGWFWQFGTAAVAAALRTWRTGDELVAIGFLDGPGVLRLALAPSARRDERLAARLVADLSDAGTEVLVDGDASVEVPNGSRVQEALAAAGWPAGEAWTPLRLDLRAGVAPPALRVRMVGLTDVPAFTAVHRSAWDSPRFTDERWHTMASGLPFADARCLLGYDDTGDPVGGITVWSAGVGRPGLIEPLGVHAAHRGRGYGTQLCRAAAATLAAMGSSMAEVCTPSTLTGAVRTYQAAGFIPQPERRDRSRPEVSGRS